jgi:molybdopterin-containing oxidoreductase family membrane subunit
MATNIRYTEIDGKGFSFTALVVLFILMVLVGVFAFFHVEHAGHAVTGMDNQIQWGMPHVFAIFMIVAASGALNIASIGTVFNKSIYKPLGRFSAWFSMALLAGGLVVLVIDLGQWIHVWNMILTPNLKSLFALNVYLYSGFFVFVGIYLWTMMDPNMHKYYRIAGTMAFIWRIILTTGTGSIFAFLVGRPLYDAAIIAPLFVVMSFSFGMAIFIIFIMAFYKLTARELGDKILFKLKNLLGVFIAGTFYFVVVYCLTNLYAAEHQPAMKWLLTGESIHTKLLWGGFLVVGTILPLLIIYSKVGKTRGGILLSSLLALVGAFALTYVIIIGGQAYPQQVAAGYTVVASSFGDAAPYHKYSPSIWELIYGIAGVSITVLLTVYGCKLLRFLPESLADKEVDPHFKSAA